MLTVAELFNLALQHHQAGSFAEAEPLYRQVLQAEPAHADACHLLGVLANQTGRPEEGIFLLRQAVALNPSSPVFHTNLGLALNKQENHAGAAVCFQQALQLAPHYLNAHFNLGLVLFKQGFFGEARESFRHALQISPDHAQAHSNLGSALVAEGRLAEAITSFRQALRIDRSYAATHLDLANALRQLGIYDEAVRSYQEAILLEPSLDEAHVGLGMIWLLQGDFEKGWSEYEWRVPLTRFGIPAYQEPRWDGSPLRGKTILLRSEQGLGDTLQFIRYARLTKELDARVVLSCPPELAGILQSCGSIDHIVPYGSALRPFDVYAPLLSLPKIFKTTLHTVPASIPYLAADPARTRHWQKELSRHSGFKVGIIWQGNPRLSQPATMSLDRRRSIPLADFKPLACIPNVQLFSLQVGYGIEQLAQWQAGSEIVDLGSKLGDFTETAAVMMNLDLIITVDTSPAHLAGALGRPVWTALPAVGCWRWLETRENSPWYPSMKLYRQVRAGDWQAVFERMMVDLKGMVSKTVKSS